MVDHIQCNQVEKGGGGLWKGGVGVGCFMTKGIKVRLLEHTTCLIFFTNPLNLKKKIIL